MSGGDSARSPLTGAGFAILLLIAFMMGSNHVAARIAFDHGVDVATAVSFRSTVTACVVGALLAFNTFPLWTAGWARVLYGHRPERRVVLAMPVMLLGLALALDVLGAASGLGAQAQWGRIGVGVAFAVAAGAIFGLALVLTQHEAGALDGRLRTASTMGIAALVAFAAVAVQGEFHFPQAPAGWGGLLALTFLYGTAFTIMFTVLPRLGVVGNSAIMNVEPIFALVLAWAILGQRIAPSQVGGGLLVVATVMWLGLGQRKAA